MSETLTILRGFLASKNTGQTALGTSKAWPPTMPFSLDPAGIHFRAWEMGCMNAINGTLDMDCNAVYLPYGDGASFAGYRPDPWVVPGTVSGLYASSFLASSFLSS